MSSEPIPPKGSTKQSLAKARRTSAAHLDDSAAASLVWACIRSGQTINPRVSQTLSGFWRDCCSSALSGETAPQREASVLRWLDTQPNRTIEAVNAVSLMRDAFLATRDGTVTIKLDDHREPCALTDLGNGERMVRKFGNRFRYCYPWKKWLVWDGRRWAIDDTAAIIRMAKKTVRSIYAEAAREANETERKAISRWAEESESKARLEAMIWAAASEVGIAVLPKDLDIDPWALNCRNGTIDLRTGRLRPHDPADLLTKMSPVEYDPDAACPLWNESLRFFLITDELISFWNRVCGMSATGVIRDHILPIAYGTGSNGKSTILGTLLEVLGGDYAMKAAPDFLMAKKNESHPTDRADLFGKRLVVAIETEDGQRLNETMLKELTGGDKIRARRMREDFWEFSPTHTIILATNHKPQVRGSDNGIWRRLKLVPFDVQVPDNEAKKDVPERLLREEMAGILAWLVRGAVDWSRDGLNPPPVVADATRTYREEEDTFGEFLAEHCVKIASARVQAGTIYEQYKLWSERSGHATWSLTRFGKEIQNRGFVKEKTGCIWYLGLGLKNESRSG